MKTHQSARCLLAVAAVVSAACTPTALSPTTAQEPTEVFKRTRVIGFSQVGQPRGGWFFAGGGEAERVRF